MRAAMWGFLVLSLLGFACTFIVESGYASQAETVQPVRRSQRSDTGWELAGPAVDLIGVPNAAYVTRGAPGIPAQVNAEVLSGATGVTPLEPVRQTVHAARIGAMGAAILMVVGLCTLGRSFRLLRTED